VRPNGFSPSFRLRYSSQVLDVPEGGFVVGRSRDCNLTLEDPLVSRRHAVFRWRNGSLLIEDLGSRNGVKVNQGRISEVVELKLGDVVSIGGQSFVVVLSDPADQRMVRTVAVTMANDSGQTGTPLDLLSGVVEKAFAMGRIEDAERILSNLLADLLASFEDGRKDSAALGEATRLALRLADETGDARWIDWVFNAHSALAKVPPAATVDRLYLLARKVRYGVTPAFKNYVSQMKSQYTLLGASDRFALQRIEGLLRVLSA
jgi:pSer/pThr/pTyr-binding forkhead associated (FHA) protein